MWVCGFNFLDALSRESKHNLERAASKLPSTSASLITYWSPFTTERLRDFLHHFKDRRSASKPKCK